MKASISISIFWQNYNLVLKVDAKPPKQELLFLDFNIIMVDLESVSLGSEFENRGSRINNSLGFISVQSWSSAKGSTPLTKRRYNFNAYNRTTNYHKQLCKYYTITSCFSSPGPKVQVNYCHHLVSVVCRLYTFHISSFSETTWPIGTRNDHWKVFYKVYVFMPI